MDEIISSIPVAEVNTDTIVEIDSKLPVAQVDVTESITVEIQPDTYVLTSSGMYTGNMTGAVPTWILNAIQEQLTTGDGNLMSVLDDMKSLLGSLQLGVNQTISQIENTNTSMSALETSLSSRIDANNAAILDVYATKVTPTEAQAIAVQAIGSTFNGNVDAYIGNLASTYTNATSAIATDIHTLQVSYNDQTARIDTVEEVSLSKNATIRSATAPTLITNPLLIIGDSWINTTNNVTKSWNGSSWVDITNTNAQQAYTWSANASKLITSPDGSVTGWSFGDGSNTKSNFKIKAENFSISDGTTGYTPFSIVGSDILLNGLVKFTNTTGGAGTLQDVVQSYVETVQVGDKNVNITDNLIPMTSLVGDVNNAGYQFVGTPTKTNIAGISVYAEPQVALALEDEVYSPFVDDLSVAYYYRFGIKNATDLTQFMLCTIDAFDVVTYDTLVGALATEFTPNTWYIVDGIINPVGSAVTVSGTVRSATGIALADVMSYTIPSGATKLLLGFEKECVVSRVKLAKVTADTVTSAVASIDYVNSTTIDGSRITTGTIAANRIDSDFVNGKVITGAKIYGAYIHGATIISSWVDTSASGYLTQWAEFMPAQVLADYSEYVGNFVHENGVLYADPQGKARLQGYQIAYPTPVTKSGTVLDGGIDIIGIKADVAAYDSYTVNTTNRTLASAPRFSGTEQVLFSFTR